MEEKVIPTNQDSNTTNDNKSTLKQSIKAIAVLVIICLVCCLLLALCNDLFYVSDEEKFNRALAKVYPGTFTVDNSFSKEPDSNYATNNVYGSILNVYKSTQGDYILQSKGIGGFSGGTVTLYVAVKAADATIVGWSIESNEGQSFIGNITSKAQKTWYIGARVDGDLALTNDNKISGTTMSSTAVNNAINMAAYYCMNALKIGANPEGEAKEAVLALLGDEYASYSLESASTLLSASVGTDTVAKLLSDGSNSITYMFRASGDKGSVYAYVYGSDESRKIVAVTDSGVVKTDNVDGSEEFYTKATTFKVVSSEFASHKTDVAIIKVDTSDAAKTVYTIVSYKPAAFVPGNYAMDVTVVTDGGVGKIDAIVVLTSGYVPGAPAKEDTEVLTKSYVGATLTTLQSIYDSDKKAGATESANIITLGIKAVLEAYAEKLAVAE